jgi:hypothetical protein
MPFKKIAKWLLGCFNGCTTNVNVSCCGGVATTNFKDDQPNRENEANPAVADLISM